MAVVDVDGSSHLSADGDSRPKSVGLVMELAATRLSIYAFIK